MSSRFFMWQIRLQFFLLRVRSLQIHACPFVASVLVSMGCGASSGHSSRGSVYLDQMEIAVAEADRYKDALERAQRELEFKDEELEKLRRALEDAQAMPGMQALGVTQMFPDSPTAGGTSQQDVTLNHQGTLQLVGGAAKPMLLMKIKRQVDPGLQAQGVDTRCFWEQMEFMKVEYLKELLHLAVERDEVTLEWLTPIAAEAAEAGAHRSLSSRPVSGNSTLTEGDGDPEGHNEEHYGNVVPSVSKVIEELTGSQARTLQDEFVMPSEPDEDSQLVDAGNLGALALPQSPVQGGGTYANRGLTDFEVSIIAQELKRIDTGMRSLNFWNNCISDVGAVRLAEVLEKNSTISNLNLKFNHIGDKGAMRLAQALESNESLQELYLSNNYIGDTGVERMIQAFNWNSGLRLVDISHNRYTELGETRLKDFIETTCREDLQIYMDLI